MSIRVQTSNSKPIYEQIYDQLKKLIIKGNYAPKQQLPSIRSMAKEVEVSVITIKKAYEDLERDGYIYSIPSKGYYVLQQDKGALKEYYLKQIDDHLYAIKSLAENFDFDNKQLLDYIDKKLQ